MAIEMDEVGEATSAVQEVLGSDFAVEDAIDNAGAGDLVPDPHDPALQEPAQRIPLDTAKANWQQRAGRRQELEALRTQQQEWQTKEQRYQEMLNLLVQQQATAQQAQQPEQPQLDPDSQAFADMMEQRIQAMLDQRLQPIMQMGQTWQQREQMTAQEQAAQAQYRDFWGQVEAAEADYRLTEQGQGYDERLAGLAETMTSFLSETIPPERAHVVQPLVNMELAGLTQLAHQLGVPPPIFVDGWIRSLVSLGQKFANGQQPQNGNGQPRRSRPSSEDVSLARKAAQRGAAGAPPGKGGPTGGPVRASDLIDRGVTAKELQTLAKEKYGGNIADATMALAMEYESRFGSE